jgi:hypothetical protein
MNESDKVLPVEEAGLASPGGNVPGTVNAADDADHLIIPADDSRKGLSRESMREWLTQYKVLSRSSTVTNAFVAALMPYDTYKDPEVSAALEILGQATRRELACVYCGSPATTWDHLVNLVQDRGPNGPGHRIRNLVPACSGCNSSKGPKKYSEWVRGSKRIQGSPEELITMLDRYAAGCDRRTSEDVEFEKEMLRLRDDVVKLLRLADALVEARKSDPGASVASLVRKLKENAEGPDPL